MSKNIGWKIVRKVLLRFACPLGSRSVASTSWLMRFAHRTPLCRATHASKLPRALRGSKSACAGGRTGKDRGVQPDFILEKPFGSVRVKVAVKDRQVTIHTALQMRSGSYSSEEFQQLDDFEKKVKSIYNEKLIVKK